MAIDFMTKMQQKAVDKSTDPIQIYEDLDRTSSAGPLRPAQLEVLNKWKTQKDAKDLIIKLHTGEGKTLIGLLILLARLNTDKEPCIYACPNIYLVNQVYEEAKKFGVPVCTIGDNNNIPDEFWAGERILVVHVQKVFNGKSIFGLDNMSAKIGAIILDDAHACLDSIRDSFAVSIKRSEEREAYSAIIGLFGESLKYQGEGSFLDLVCNSDYNSLMTVPYWALYDKKTELLKILANYTERKFLRFSWDFIKDSLDKCQIFVSGGEIQIIPEVSYIERYGVFSKANQRILMSATTQDDALFVRTLGFSVEAVRNPLVSGIKGWSGEKMILLPSLISEAFSRETMISGFCKANSDKIGIVALTPTNRIQDEYVREGAILADKETINNAVKNLREGVFGKVVALSNRYDGIDLPDNSCRILIIDSMPFFMNMGDRYEEKCRYNCSIIKKKLAQKIEQGLGRCVRSEKDYACVIIIGNELVNFLRSKQTKGLFSAQTQKQIEIGLRVAEWAREDDNFGFTDLTNLINQCLKRDDGWKQFYKSEMDSIVEGGSNDEHYYEVLEKERMAEELFSRGSNEEANRKIQELLDDNLDIDDADKGWYLQLMARYIYQNSKIEANRLQKRAFDLNSTLLKPQDGVAYRKMGDINLDRISMIKEQISQFEDYEQLMLEINSLCETLSFGKEAKKFEAALDEAGRLLGFNTQRPDNMCRVGPDNLWRTSRGKYVFFECKSEVKLSRELISKNEVGQMNNHCGWFEQEYDDSRVIRIMIIPTNVVSREANFTHDVRIMTTKELELFKNNFQMFFKELKNYDIKNLETNFVDNCIRMHNLKEDDFESLYSSANRRQSD